MGREIRRVPANWEHPKTERYFGQESSYQPMYDQTFESASQEWCEAFAKWQSGERPEYFTPTNYPADYQYWEWENGPPDRAYYRPYADEEATWVQVYETVSEGTPVSPPFATREELIDYLATNGDFWDQSRGDGPWARASAIAFVNSGWAPSMMFVQSDEGSEFVDSRDIAATLNP